VSFVQKLKEKIGQMMMIGIQGEELTRDENRLIENYPFGGFILFSHNLKEPKQILSLCRSLWEISEDAPPFVAIDQEGGRVHRLPAPFTHFPPAATLGRTANPELPYKVGVATARELSAVGINLNFSPVLDVNSNPTNPVIGDRALSFDPEQVTQLGWSVVRGLRTGGIIPCAKHFPGHGDTSEDSHLVLPIVKKDNASLRAVELKPFVYACQNQVESLMTAHVLYPALDPQYPATLSQKIIADLLRKELCYEGVVFGDDMEMKAIAENYRLEEASALSVGAGVDVLMFCHQQEAAVRAFEFLHREAEKNKEIRTRMNESDQRIRRLKERFLKSPAGVCEEDLNNRIGLPEHHKIIEEIQGSL
jgi:beta-N-acetylhexosaminidase